MLSKEVMRLDRTIIAQLDSAPWLRECGKSLPESLSGVVKALDEDRALSLFSSTSWADARTEAQGDLTGYLSLHHYSAYGGCWNQLVKEATRIVESVALEPLRSALQQRGWPDDMSKSIVVDLTRAILECSYREKFKNAPAFFDTVLAIYSAGHLPCGWGGEMSNWREGAIIAY